jgi:hypothetical protein
MVMKMSETCPACGGTGINSKGGVCYPCKKRKQVTKESAEYFVVSREPNGEVTKHAGPFTLFTASQTIPIIVQCPVYIIEERDGKQEPVARWKDGGWQLKK